VNAGDRDRAISLIKLPANADVERAKQQMRDARGLDLSAGGIDILEREGAWGKATDVLPDFRRLSRIMEDAGVTADSTYGLTYRNALSVFHWDGNQFKILYLDDVDKLDRPSQGNVSGALPRPLRQPF
jgi:hypothetical protein